MKTVEIDGIEIVVHRVPAEQIIDARALARRIVERRGWTLEAAE